MIVIALIGLVIIGVWVGVKFTNNYEIKKKDARKTDTPNSPTA